MARPGVNIATSNGGLNLQPPSENGTSVLVVASPVAPVAGYSVPFLIKTKSQAATAFAQAGNEAVVTAIVNGFFGEAPEGTKLYVIAYAPATTLTQLADASKANPVLNMAAGNGRLVAFVKFPAVDYEPTVTEGFDEDVHTAVTAAQTLSQAWFAKKQPFRFWVDGFAFTEQADVKDYATAANRNGEIVVFNINDSTQWATLQILGRAAAAEPQQHIGRIKSGSLNIPDDAVVKIGAVDVDDMNDGDLDGLFDKRYVSIERNAIESGYVVTDDSMLTKPDDDYNNLRYGRVMDNAVRVTYAAYYQELKDDVDVDEDTGQPSTVVVKALENAIESAIDSNMRGQLSTKQDGTADVTVYVNPDPVAYAALYEQNDIDAPNFNLLETGSVYIFARMKPKGCLKYINVFLGYTSTSI